MMILASFVFDFMYVIYPIILFILFIGLRIVLVKMRKKTDLELQRLLFKLRNLFLYEELLNNPRLGLLFTKTEKEFLRLNGYMALGSDEKIIKQFDMLSKLKLKPKLALDLYHKEMTYYIDAVKYDKALISYNKLKKILLKQKQEQAKKLLEEADLIVSIYIKKDITLIPLLIEKEKHTDHMLMKGVIYYRLAKLSYFAKKLKDVDLYLKRAEPLLKQTTYESIINSAFKDYHILQTK